MRELAVQAGNGTMNSDDQAALDKEFQALDDEVIGLHQRLHGRVLSYLMLQVDLQEHLTGWCQASKTIDVTIADMQSAALGVNFLEVSDTTKANAAITALDRDKESIDRKSKSRLSPIV